MLGRLEDLKLYPGNVVMSYEEQMSDREIKKAGCCATMLPRVKRVDGTRFNDRLVSDLKNYLDS